MYDNKSITLAHLSDVHLSPISGFEPRYWNLKRTLGWINWQRKRRFVHRRAALDAIVADLKAQAPDHILVSGDLINIGLPAEYQAARAWLETLGPPDRVSVVPGNHDAYVAADARAGLRAWGPYMMDDEYGRSLAVSVERTSADPCPVGFPYVRRIENVAIVGVSSGVATPPGSAEGEVGTVQLARLAKLLNALGARRLTRVVMIHHPPVPGLATRGRALRDAAAFARTLEHCGAELAVHGHNHTLTHSAHAGCAIEGVGSASASQWLGHEPLACYNLIHIPAPGTNAPIGIETRGISMIGGPVATLAVRTLPPHNMAVPMQDKGPI